MAVRSKLNVTWRFRFFIPISTCSAWSSINEKWQDISCIAPQDGCVITVCDIDSGTVFAYFTPSGCLLGAETTFQRLFFQQYTPAQHTSPSSNYCNISKQSCGAVVKMTQLRLRLRLQSSSFHEHGSGSSSSVKRNFWPIICCQFLSEGMKFSD